MEVSNTNNMAIVEQLKNALQEFGTNNLYSFYEPNNFEYQLKDAILPFIQKSIECDYISIDHNMKRIILNHDVPLEILTVLKMYDDKLNGKYSVYILHEPQYIESDNGDCPPRKMTCMTRFKYDAVFPTDKSSIISYHDGKLKIHGVDLEPVQN